MDFTDLFSPEVVEQSRHEMNCFWEKENLECDFLAW